MASHSTPFAAFILASFFSLASPSLAEDAKPPLPLPDDASGMTYDGESGSLTFSSAKPIKELAAMYRDYAKQHGWEEQAGVINKDNMVVMTFMASGEDVATITVMKMGDNAEVTAEGTALEAKGGA
ncbi:MAG: hypothetical protein KGO53_14970, partial [Alphaproteobacteria bacterium]|nr:hypothetical protein [Alphaproteobacteria bacterium]